MIVAAFISDRGDRYLPGCLASYLEHVEPIVDDVTVINDELHRLGLAGAVQAAWEWALDVNADYLLHVEEDFVFEQPVLLTEMAALLDSQPHLAELVLKRQPWSSEEKAAGGIIEMNPGAYTQMGQIRAELNYRTVDMLSWVEHELLFSLNPCLLPRRTLELGWPAGPLGVGNETGMTKRCLDVGMRFAYWGHRDDPPRVTHVGSVRGAGWRL